MSVCVHVRMYVGTYLRMYLGMYVFMYLCMYVCMPVRLYVCMYACMCVCVYTRNDGGWRTEAAAFWCSISMFGQSSKNPSTWAPPADMNISLTPDAVNTEAKRANATLKLKHAQALSQVFVTMGSPCSMVLVVAKTNSNRSLDRLALRSR